MTLLLLINSDQTYPFELNINENKKNSTGKAFVTSAEQQLKGNNSTITGFLISLSVAFTEL